MAGDPLRAYGEALTRRRGGPTRNSAAACATAWAVHLAVFLLGGWKCLAAGFACFLVGGIGTAVNARRRGVMYR